MRIISRWFLVFPLLFLLVSCNIIFNKEASFSITIDDSDLLRNTIDSAWVFSWQRFYSDKTNQFYDYIISYKMGEELAHLPKSNEIEMLYPNKCGYDTGMEDCMISAGIMLNMVVDQYKVTRDKRLKSYAYKIFKGIEKSSTVHGVYGFLARGVCIEDSKSTYICTSRDQYTHAVYGLWTYYHSELSNDDTKSKIQDLLVSYADRMYNYVTPENNYSFLLSDGSVDSIGISKMWNVMGHEAARLPMIYAAAWDVSGNSKYSELYRKYIVDAIKQSFNIVPETTTYGLLQMQCSLELLKKLEDDNQIIRDIEKLMKIVSNMSEQRAIRAFTKGESLDLTLVTSDWRTGVGIKPGSLYRNVWYCVRESGEAALSQIMEPISLISPYQKELLKKVILRIDYSKVTTSGIFYLQAAYWKAKSQGIEFN